MKYKKLFIIGCPRSGTSWVRSIFLTHPSAIGIESESHAYPIIMKPFRKSFRKSATANEKWKYVLGRYDELAQNFGKKGFYKSGYWVPGSGSLINYIEQKKFYKFIQQAQVKKDLSDIEKAQLVITKVFDDFFITHGGTEKHLFVEKTPSHAFYAYQILTSYPEAKIIEVIRDGRDVCVSLEMQAKIESWAPKERKDQITTWKKYIEKGLELRSNQELAKRILPVRYEKLKENPKKEIESMFKFVSIDSSPGLVARIAWATDSKNVKKTRPSRNIRKGIVGDWKNHFTDNDIKLFKEMANDLLVKLGYKW